MRRGCSKSNVDRQRMSLAQRCDVSRPPAAARSNDGLQLTADSAKGFDLSSGLPAVKLY